MAETAESRLRIPRRAFHFRLLLGLLPLLLVVLSGDSAPPRAERLPADVLADSLAAGIDRLRCAGEYAAALDRARERQRLFRGLSAVRHWCRLEADRSVQELDRICGFSLAQQSTLTAAERRGVLCDSLLAQGRWSDAAIHAQAQLEAFASLFGMDEEPVLDAQSRWCLCLHRQGEYATAEPMARRILACRRCSLSADDPRLSDALNLLALVLYGVGDGTAAEDLFAEAAEVRRRGRGEGIDYASSLHNLSPVMRDNGKLDEAEALLHRAQQLRRRWMGEDNLGYARGLHSLAVIHHRRREYAESERLFSRALVLRRRWLGDEHPDIATTLADRATMLMDWRRHGEALPLYRQALAMRRKFFEPAAPLVIETLRRIAVCELELGSYAAAESIAGQAVAPFEEARRRAGTGFRRRTTLAPYLFVALARLGLGKFDEAWEAAERSQAQSLAELMAARRMRPPGESEWTLRDSLQHERMRLERLAADLRGGYEGFEPTAPGPGTADRAAALARALSKLDEATAAMDQLEREDLDAIAARGGWTFPLHRVQAALSRETAIVGWVGRQEYWAYVVRRSGPVRWVKLDIGPQSVSRRSRDVFAYCNSLEQAACWPRRVADDEHVRSRAHELWETFFAPVEPLLVGVRRLVFVRSSPLHGLALETLVDAAGEPLGERYSVTYAPSCTVYATLRERRLEEGSSIRACVRGAFAHGATPGGGGRRAGGAAGPALSGVPALLVGDPSYNEAQLAEMFRKESSSGRPRRGASADEWVVSPWIRGGIVGGALRGDRRCLDSLPRLPGTRDEVEQARALIPGAMVLLGPDATRETLESMSRRDVLSRFKLIHLGTHALIDPWAPERCALVLSRTPRDRAAQGIQRRAKIERGGRDGIERASSMDAPEADDFPAGPRDGHLDDGLVRLDEVVRTWRLNADIVILSGCRTALGREGWEGVVEGFPSALLVAGARSVLVSLWPVEDRSACLLLGRFYRNLYGRDAQAQGQPLEAGEALQEAKHWLRTLQDEQGHRPFAHPAYWGAYVLVGA